MEVLWRHKPRSCADFVAQVANLRQQGLVVIGYLYFTDFFRQFDNLIPFQLCLNHLL